jgi:hypothetical protein
MQFTDMLSDYDKVAEEVRKHNSNTTHSSLQRNVRPCRKMVLQNTVYFLSRKVFK